jgi:hypothetical protein
MKDAFAALLSRNGRLEEVAAAVAIFSLDDMTLRLKPGSVNTKPWQKYFVKLPENHNKKFREPDGQFPFQQKVL